PPPPVVPEDGRKAAAARAGKGPHRKRSAANPNLSPGQEKKTSWTNRAIDFHSSILPAPAAAPSSMAHDIHRNAVGITDDEVTVAPGFVPQWHLDVDPGVAESLVLRIHIVHIHGDPGAAGYRLPEHGGLCRLIGLQEA